MGRIEEALRRVAAEVERLGSIPATRAEEPDDDLFTSPWDAEPAKPTPVADIARRVRPQAPAPPRLSARAKTDSGVRPEAPPSVRLESQLAMEWPRPFAADAAGKVVATKSADPAAVEQYRRLADALRQVQRERGAKIVMIASAVAGEGRTLTATNLALSLADAPGQRVLLIDADLRHPRIHQLFQVTAGAGLTGALQSSVSGKLPVIGLTAGVALLPAGRPQGDPAPLIDSARMREVLAEASRSYDWIVLDTPPVTMAPDAGLLAPMADLALLVVDAGRTPRSCSGRSGSTSSSARSRRASTGSSSTRRR